MNAPHKPLVVLVATTAADKARTAGEVRTLARKWRDAKERAPVVFAWMDADKWGTWLKSMYGISGTGVVVADHSVRFSNSCQFHRVLKMSNPFLG